MQRTVATIVRIFDAVEVLDVVTDHTVADQVAAS
jgi:hypothetical protein